MSVALGVTLLIARPTHAQTLGPTLLSYRAPDNCPEVAEFQKSVQRRSARVRFVDEGSHERELSLVLSKEGEFTIGELRLIERDGSLRQRSVRFSSCAEAVEGLALITVVSLDPQALLQPPATPEPTPENPPAAPVPPKPSSKPAAHPEPETPPPPPPDSQPLDSSRSSRLEAALGGELVAGFHQFPETAFGGSLFVDVGSRSTSWLAPLVRLAVTHSERRFIPTRDGDANFALTHATLTGCPLRVGDRAISLRPCVFTSAGVLRAWTTASLDPQTRTRPAWAWGGSALVFLQVSQTTEIVADFSVSSPLIRDRFEVGQSWSWTTRALYLSSGVGLRFVFR